MPELDFIFSKSDAINMDVKWLEMRISLVESTVWLKIPKPAGSRPIKAIKAKAMMAIAKVTSIKLKPATRQRRRKKGLGHAAGEVWSKGGAGVCIRCIYEVFRGSVNAFSEKND
jgi:hypothetical protein